MVVQANDVLATGTDDFNEWVDVEASQLLYSRTLSGLIRDEWGGCN